MTRPLRLAVPGGLYNVTVRGNARGRIYLCDADRLDWIDCLARTVERYAWILHAFCQMGNHAHLLVETPLANLSEGMRQVNGTFAQRFNRRHKHVGHVFQTRFWSELVEKQRHLLELVRYIVLNPCRAGLCDAAADWAWSSYRATAGIAVVPPFLTVDWILGQFASSRGTAQERFAAFVADGTGVNPFDELRGEIYLGSDDFALARSSGAGPLRDVPRVHWAPVRPPLDELLRDGDPFGLLRAHHDHGYVMRELGDHLGRSISTISRRLREVEELERAIRGK